MKSQLFKQLAAVFLIIFALLSIYFGSYLPLVKAQRYISFTQSLSNVKTLEEFQSRSKNLFEFHSPIGQEEAVKFLSRDIVNIVRNPNQGEQISRELVNLIEPYILKRNVRHLLTMSEIYSILWTKHKREEDFLKAESYFLETLKIGPNLPPALYPLFDLYRFHGDSQKMKKIGGTILQYWPEDNRVKEVMQSIQ